MQLSKPYILLREPGKIHEPCVINMTYCSFVSLFDLTMLYDIFVHNSALIKLPGYLP